MCYLLCGIICNCIRPGLTWIVWESTFPFKMQREQPTGLVGNNYDDIRTLCIEVQMRADPTVVTLEGACSSAQGYAVYQQTRPRNRDRHPARVSPSCHNYMDALKGLN